MINFWERARRVRRGDDDGFALILTVMVTMVVTIAVAGVFAVVQPSIAGVKHTQDDAAAFIAARSGLEDAMAYLNEIPSCRSASQVCAAALAIGNGSNKEVNTTNLADAGRARPNVTQFSLPAGSTDKNQSFQSFSWRMLQQLTPEGYLRVVSTGTYPARSVNSVSRTLVADFALKPSLLRFGYYTDYESFSPAFLSDYYKPRSVYISDASTYSNVSSSYRGSTAVPRYANWTSPTSASNCGQHWYAEPALGLPGRSSNGSAYSESGRLGTTTSTTSGTTVSRSGTCDLTFNASMAQNGETYTRDAILSSGAGPKFQKPVWTLWGYTSGSTAYTDPAFTTAGKYYRGDTMTNTPNTPQVANQNLSIPTSVGKDGIPANACVYFGPTRVKLNGNGTATVTSPLTRSRNAASDSGCYPSSVAAGIVGWTYSFNTYGAGAIVTRNLGSAPSAGWPANPTRSTQTPAAGNEVFYFNAPGSTDVTAHTDSSVAPYAGCSSTVKYSNSTTATCAWTNVGAANDSTSSTGWTTYTKTTCSSTVATNRQLFECEYPNLAASASPAVAQSTGQYKTFRDLVMGDLANNGCVAKTGTTLATCVDDIVENRLTPANSTSVTNGAHRYLATTAAGTAATTTTTGATGVGPDGTTNDPFFTQPTPAKESDTRNQVTVTVKRQVYNSSSSSWGSDTPAFTFTTTLHDYTYTAPRGMTYFPNENDVTPYNVGTDAAGTAIRGTGVTPQGGDRQPGDLYVDGANKGKLSLLADNDVIVTGDVTNPAGYTPDTDAVSITAGQDVRNYHPVKCSDQDATDINNTTPGFCPNDITGLSTSSFVSGSSYTSAAPAEQYVNIQPAADRNIYAAVFALSGSFGTDSYNRGDPLGNINIYGGLYQSHRGGNGVASGSTYLSGATLQYNYVDLQRANLPYVPPTRSGNDPHPWQIVSVSSG